MGESFLKVQDSKLHTPLKVAEFNAKGGLISESFSLWLKSPKKGAKNILSTTHKLKKLRIVIRYFFGENQTEKLFEIKPPLLH